MMTFFQSVARITFWFRTWMAQFSENYRNNVDIHLCPLCKKHIDTQKLAFKCPVVLENINISGRYDEIFGENISKQLALNLKSILNLRQSFQFASQGFTCALICNMKLLQFTL